MTTGNLGHRCLVVIMYFAWPLYCQEVVCLLSLNILVTPCCLVSGAGLELELGLRLGDRVKG